LSQTQSVLTKGQREILELVNQAGEVSIDEFRESIDDLRILLERGHLRLKVEVSEWGMSFDLISGNGGRVPAICQLV
jgi:hypothetical protein